MPVRPGDTDEAFKEKLKNPPKPINDTSASPQFEEYLNSLNNGAGVSEETRRKQELAKKREEEGKIQLICPSCRKTTLKKAPQGWGCGFCGMSTNSPIRMKIPEPVTVTPEAQPPAEEKKE